MERLTDLDYMAEVKLIDDARAEYRVHCAIERRQLAPKGDDVWKLEQKQNMEGADWIKKRVQGKVEAVIESGRPLNMDAMRVEFNIQADLGATYNQFMKDWATTWKVEHDKHREIIHEFYQKNAGLRKLK